MKIFKKIIAVLCVICMCPSLVAFASDDKYLDVNDAVMVISANDEIGFALYKTKTENDLKGNAPSLLDASKNIQKIHTTDTFIIRVITKKFLSILLLLSLLMMARLQLVMRQIQQFL